MATFRFAVLSDVHLGAPRFGAPALEGDAARALEAAVTRLLEDPPAFVLLAGNLFHRALVGPGDLAAAEAQLQRLAGVPVVAIEGDREAMSRDSFMRYLGRRGLLRCLAPDFDPGDQRYRARPWDPVAGVGTYCEPVEGVRVHGLGVGGGAARTRLEHMIPALERGDGVSLGLYHGRRDDLHAEGLGALRSKLDFVACGHPTQRGHDGWAYSPGGLVPVHLAEVDDERPGLLLVEARDGTFQAERVPVAGRPVARLEPYRAPEGVEAPDALLRDLDAFLARHETPPGAVVALRLTGEVPFTFADLDPEQVAARARDTLGAGHVLVVNELNLGADAGEPGLLDRRAIEREVLADALREELPELAHRHDELLDLVGAIRRRDLDRDEDLVEILDLAKAFVERGDAADPS